MNDARRIYTQAQPARDALLEMDSLMIDSGTNDKGNLWELWVLPNGNRVALTCWRNGWEAFVQATTENSVQETIDAIRAFAALGPEGR